MIKKIYAHTLANRPEREWEPLTEHLEKVAISASKFAEAFGASDWGAVVGRCHDLGKFSEEFQRYLRMASNGDASNAGVEDQRVGRIDHSTFGARYVMQKVGGLAGQLMAFCIAGHHAGLPNESSGEEAAQSSTLRRRLDETLRIPEVYDPELLLTKPAFPLSVIGRASTGRAFQIAFFTRMIFSCLVDADRTRTEEFCAPERAAERSRSRPSISDLKGAFDVHMESKSVRAPASAVNDQRAFVLFQCREAATLEKGFFSLNVPTGGGKTLSSLVFALDHALAREMRRVIVAIPFTSIIEQTADVYREALGTLAETGLVEHHTNLQPDRDTRANQFATENWDAPLVVTTNVQLFESLFAAATTPCRKLHHLAGSVIILDEAQTIPVDLLEPTLMALKELVRSYGCSVVLCTATQPALERREGFEPGIEGIRHIISDPKPLFHALKRVEVRWTGKLKNEELATRLADESSVLCIVNTRRHAARLYELVVQSPNPNPGRCFHLSTWMCGQHRREVIKQIREVAGTGSCHVVSTPLIEAGVDLDFPIVYRATAGFDSIAQAAGRCNREGRLPLGYTHVFEAEELPPPGLQRDAAQAAHELKGRFEDPIAPEAIEAYFRQYFWSQRDSWDKHRLMSMMSLDPYRPRAVFQFREIAEKYKIIRDNQLPILVPYDKIAEDFCLRLLSGHVDFIPQRQLQPYLVSMPERAIRLMEKEGVVQAHDSGVWVLLRADAYTSAKGLDPEAYSLDPSLWGV